MLKPRDEVIAEISRAEGVMMTMYALIRDMGITNKVEADKDGKLGDVLGDAMNGLQRVVELWDTDPAEEAEDEEV